MERELQDPTVSPYIVYYILGCRITLPCLYLYNIGFLYDANIQYVQLLYWAILVVHIYYSVSFILGYSNRTKFYNKPIILYGSILYFWFSLVDQCFAIYYYKLGSLYKTIISFIYWSALSYQTYSRFTLSAQYLFRLA